jgi:hypothetical protein
MRSDPSRGVGRVPGNGPRAVDFASACAGVNSFDTWTRGLPSRMMPKGAAMAAAVTAIRKAKKPHTSPTPPFGLAECALPNCWS